MREVVVAGGGPAGAAAATILASAGRDVLVLERDRAPADKVCGDFLSVEAQHALRELGLDLARLGPSRIGTVRLMHGNRVAEAALPFGALGLSRRALDAALLDLAAERGAAVRRGVRVQTVGRDGTLGTSEGAQRPAAVFLATGKHELRGAGREGRAPKSVGFKAYLSLPPGETAGLRGVVEMILFDGGYAGLLLVEGEVANLSLVVRADRLVRAGGAWDALLRSLGAECPALARRIAGARPLRARPLAISGLPYGFVHRPGRADAESVYRVGDQAAVIPSLTGDGVAIALHTARLAAEAYLARRTAAEHHAALRRDLRGQMLRAAVIHRACLAGPLQPAVVSICRALPQVMRLAAAWTRIADPLAPAVHQWEGGQETLSFRETVG